MASILSKLFHYKYYQPISQYSTRYAAIMLIATAVYSYDCLTSLFVSLNCF